MVHTYFQNVTKNPILNLYGAKRVIITSTANTQVKAGSYTFQIGNSLAYVNTIAPLEFPVIDGKSPNSLIIDPTPTTEVYFRVFILELGGVPSDDYWDL